ncbi:aldehyde dehydrogenase [Chloropicon primus]|uniref:Aldehyde dehydrogenase n=1 Tax=Chloropicon primus TaxID=1764295 RepID=A0A5B8MGP4_9CHLO|nr:aldehyde dehydrogenase [Chloropicon primus]UPQ98838.1 aldehyde dehydrogenase [Chloropicon primus]|mmetsp:Transcript_2178/g.4981  ORF Transcript_2178/g.4981 Transcript_2178/m.4981 type:complete len:558 (-) Transcript_2178:628-2301(-)|eukprot:QDZ19626.1 aldehyde dehydrogenase [Chloropicon primus]
MLRLGGRVLGLSSSRGGVARMFSSSGVLSWAGCDPSKQELGKVLNVVGGEWVEVTGHASAGDEAYVEVVDPMNGQVMAKVNEVGSESLHRYVSCLDACPKSGLHNPLKRPERYLLYGNVCSRVAEALNNPEVEAYFTDLIIRVAPKSRAQALGEVQVTRKFFENFCGDNVRFLCKSFVAPGDYAGQRTEGMRWPFGKVALITPFNFPLEIPALQLMGALFMGNKPVLKVDTKVSVVMAEFLKLLNHCGMPLGDLCFINCDGETMHELLMRSDPRNTLFTGSSRVAELLAKDLNGKIKLEDAGFDWKILGPDVPQKWEDIKYIAAKADQDAFAFSGQKCSAQSILFMHENWEENTEFLELIKERASKRKLADLTIGPVLSVNNEQIGQHIKDVLALDGAQLLFGGKPLEGHDIPGCYGAYEPTAIHVPIKTMLRNEASFELVTKEIFGPFQIVTEYSDSELDLVLEACERMNAHLTAALVSNDVLFRQKVLANTVNGTTYAGLRARTTGAPQNHWFGPAGDPRAAGIGTIEAIQAVWSCHREIIYDEGPIPKEVPPLS